MTKTEMLALSVIIISALCIGWMLSEYKANDVIKSIIAHTQYTMEEMRSVMEEQQHETRQLRVASQLYADILTAQKLAEQAQKPEMPKGWVALDTGIGANTLKRLVATTLKKNKVYSKNMEELLLYTAAVETAMGNQFFQMKGGPARGIFQMEPVTEKHVRKWMEKQDAYKDFANLPNDAMLLNLDFQIMAASAYYTMRTKGKLPDWQNPDAVWDTYKKHWNSTLGATTRDFAEVRVACLLPYMAEKHNEVK